MRHRAMVPLLGLVLVLAAPRAALPQAFTFTPLDVPFPGAVHTQAFGINTAGQIVGEFTDPGSFHGFLFDGATFTPLDVPFPGAFNTEARGINDAGQIVGEFEDPSGRHGFLATPAP